MTVATSEVVGITAYSHLAPNGMLLGLAANIAPYKGWLLGVNSSGYLTTQAAGTAGLLPFGFADRRSAGDADAGDATMVCRHVTASGFPNSTAANDAILATDIAVPAWAADNQTIGRKSNSGGSNRSLVGLALGLAEDDTPIVVHGPIGGLLARAALMANAFPLASFHRIDAAASDTLTRVDIIRPKVHGTVTSITFTGAAIAADNTDYVTITVHKTDGAGGAQVLLGTYDSRAANNGAVTAHVPASFTLSVVAGALDLLETDTVEITIAKGGAGKVVSGAFLVNGKAL